MILLLSTFGHLFQFHNLVLWPVQTKSSGIKQESFLTLKITRENWEKNKNKKNQKKGYAWSEKIGWKEMKRPKNCMLALFF